MAALAIAGLLTALVSTGCSPSTPTPSPAPAPALRGSAGAAPQAPAHSATAITFEPFSVRVTLAPEAAAAIARRHETLIVAASYYGWPAEGRTLPVDDVGQVAMGRAEHELSNPGTTRFTGSGFKAAGAGALKGGPRVNINVYSGRRSSPDNLLDCGMFEDTLAVAARSVVALHCKLLSAP